MNGLEQLVHSSYVPLLDVTMSLDDTRDFIQTYVGNIEHYSLRGVLDQNTINALKTNEWFTLTNRTMTRAGAATYFRSLVDPLTSVGLIVEKQNSLIELGNNQKLLTSIIDSLRKFSSLESDLYGFFQSKLSTLSFDYGQLDNAMLAVKSIGDAARTIPPPKSPYLTVLVNDLKNFRTSRLFDLIKGPMYLTFSGLKTSDEVSTYTPRIKFKEKRITPITSLPAVIGLAYYASKSSATSNYPTVGLVLGGLMTVGMCTLVKPFTDSKVALNIRSKLLMYDKFKTAFDSFGKLDELVSFLKYASQIQTLSENYAITLPTFLDGTNEHTSFKSISNPIILAKTGSCVTNDLVLDNNLVYITGPNNKGKTTFVETLIYNSILAQTGAFILGEGRLNILTKINYTIPVHSDSKAGRLKTELIKGQEIYELANSKSLDIFDEPMGGTTTDTEKDVLFYKNLLRLYNKGCITMVTSHNPKVAQWLEEDSVGKFFEIKHNRPYVLIPGISTTSNAFEIAREVGYISEQEEMILSQKKYEYEHQLWIFPGLKPKELDARILINSIKNLEETVKPYISNNQLGFQFNDRIYAENDKGVKIEILC